MSADPSAPAVAIPRRVAAAPAERLRPNMRLLALLALVLMANVTSSLIQPLFGYFADRTARRWVLPLSVLLSSLGIGLTGLAPSYDVVLVLVVITGFGVAAYHPEGYRTATAVAGDRKVTGVSIFSTGGNIGIAAGPPLITALVTGLGLPGTLGMLIPGILVASLLTAVLPTLSVPGPSRA